MIRKMTPEKHHRSFETVKIDHHFFEICHAPLKGLIQFICHYIVDIDYNYIKIKGGCKTMTLTVEVADIDKKHKNPIAELVQTACKYDSHIEIIGNGKNICSFACSYIKDFSVGFFHFQSADGCIYHIIDIHEISGFFSVFKNFDAVSVSDLGGENRKNSCIRVGK